MASFHKLAISWLLILVTDVFVASKMALNLWEFSFRTSNFYLAFVSQLHYLSSIGLRNWREYSFPFLMQIILHSILHTIRYYFPLLISSLYFPEATASFPMSVFFHLFFFLWKTWVTEFLKTWLILKSNSIKFELLSICKNC